MTSVPSVTQWTESSGPSSRSSITIVAPLRPNRCSTSIASIAPSASSTVEQTITPRSDCTHFQTRACSRTPEPTTRTFIDSARFAQKAPKKWFGSARFGQNARNVERLLPLDGAGRFRCDVKDNPVDALDLVDNAVADPRQDLVRHPGPVCSHGVLARDDSHRNDIGIGAEIAHHADGLERREDGE